MRHRFDVFRLLFLFLAMMSYHAQGAELTPEHCIHAYAAELGACAVATCKRAVKAGLPLPTTATVPQVRASFSQSGQTPVSVQVTGRVSFQQHAGPFFEAEFSCTVEDNMIVEVRIMKPNLAVNPGAPSARRLP